MSDPDLEPVPESAACPTPSELRELAVGALVAQRRAARGLSQRALAAQLEMAQSQLSRIERGATVLRWSECDALARALGWTLDALGERAARVVARLDAVARRLVACEPGEDGARAAHRVAGRTGVSGLLAFAAAVELRLEEAPELTPDAQLR